MIRAEYFMRDPHVSHSPKLIRNPEVSVILPTYCRGDNGLLERAIESVLSQSFANFELIVMDDGSTDNTTDLVSSYVKADDRVIHVRHDTNCGLPALRVNEGFLMARGDIFAYQFDDDRWKGSLLQTLVGELRNKPTFEVAYGLCQSIVDGEQRLLGGPFNYSQLVGGNFIANNSLIHRRSVLERLGGYDMHVVMRRLCDWDLWLRWGRDAAFLFVDAVVSSVDGGKADSIGKTVTCDSFATRAYMTLDRTANLRPDALKSYVIDELDNLKHLGEVRVDALWRQQVAPYQSRLRHIWTALRPPRAKPLHVLVTKAHFDTTIDITVTNFAEGLAGDFVFTFVPQMQADESAIRSADILVLHRTIDQHAEQLAEIARKLRKPVIFLMDDDLTCLHELAEEFAYLAPGTPCRLALESMIRRADLVITYSRLMQESVHSLNPRNVVLETNIQRKWLANSKSRLNKPADGLGPVRIGFAGGGSRREELDVLWPAIVEVSRHLGTRAEFHFWGFTPSGMEQLESPYHCEPFTFAYEQYLGRLISFGFDVMIAPLFAEKRAKRAKCPIKFLEITAAGALGVYSDVEPYRSVVDGVSGIKCENTVESWTAAILQAASLHPAGRMRLVSHAIEVIEKSYTSEGQAPRLAATLEAGGLHSLLNRAPSGKPRIAYFSHSPYLGGAENHLLRHATLAKTFQFEPVLVLPSSVSKMAEEMQQRAVVLGIDIAYLPVTVETEIDLLGQLDQSSVAEIQRWLRQHQIALVHSVTILREVGEATRRLGIPHCASLYQTDSHNPSTVNHCDVVHSDSFYYASRWGEVFNVPTRRILSYVPDRYFEAGESKSKAGPPAQHNGLTIGLLGTLQPRKGQLNAVEAVGLLKKQFGVTVQLYLYGYEQFYPEYVSACKDMAYRYGVSDLVIFQGFVTDTAAALRSVDVVLCASDRESLPQAILEGMAARCFVIAPNVGGIAEVISDRTGILMPDAGAASICQALIKILGLTGDEWSDRIDLAYEVVRAECSEYSVATELFRFYRQAAAGYAGRLDKATSRLSGSAESVVGVAPVTTTHLCESLELLRSQLHEINMEMRVAE